MDTETTSHDVTENSVVNETETATSVEGEPKRLLVGKRIVRHFNVRTSIQTGSLSGRVRCR